MTTANKVTIGRILLVPFFVVHLIYYTGSGNELHRFLGLLSFALAAISDGVEQALRDRVALYDGSVFIAHERGVGDVIEHHRESLAPGAGASRRTRCGFPICFQHPYLPLCH
jgi:hypothetical protein